MSNPSDLDLEVFKEATKILYTGGYTMVQGDGNNKFILEMLEIGFQVVWGMWN